MLSFQQMFLRKAMNRANQLLRAGDAEGAREEMTSFVRRFPRSAQGWSLLYWTVGHAGGSIEDRLNVLREGAKAVPYEIGLVDALVHQLINATVLIGDSRYLDEAMGGVDAFEEVLGRSAESIVMRAVVTQFRGDVQEALALCHEAERLLAQHPQDGVSAKLGLCLASIPGHEQRGVEIAEAAARRSKQYATYLFLIALVEERDPGKASFFREEAVRFATRQSISEEQLEEELRRVRVDLDGQRDYLAAL